MSDARKPETVNRIISDLREQGTEDSAGAFTLDRDKAREKMRQFQLADPHRYVLELVQAAVLKGATKVRFDIDADDMRMRFDGAPFTAEDFDRLYNALFVRHHTADNDARRELALGLNAAMALNPRWIRVESGDGETGARLEMRPGRDDVFEAADDVSTGTLVHVKQRFRPGLMVQFVKNIRGTLPEEEVLRSRCELARIPIDLEGDVLSDGLSLPGAFGVVEIDEPGLAALVGFRPGGGSAG